MSDLPIFSFKQNIENGGFELPLPLPQKEPFYVRAETIVSEDLTIAGELVIQSELTLFAELTLRPPCLRQTIEKIEGIYGFQVNSTGSLPTGIVQDHNAFTGVRVYDAYTAYLQKTFITSPAIVTTAHTGYGGVIDGCLVFNELVLRAELRISNELTIRSVEKLYEETGLVPYASDYASQLPYGAAYPLDLTSAGVWRDLILTGEKTFTLTFYLKGAGSHTLALTDLANNLITTQALEGHTTWHLFTFSYRPLITTTFRFWLLPDRACQQIYTDAWGILTSFPLIVERAIGFHAPEVDLLVTPYAGLDGSYLHGTRIKPRKLALEGFIDAIDDDELVLRRDEIWSIINPRTQGSFIQQPFTLTYCPSEDYADAVNIDVVYESGLETMSGAINPNLSLSFIAPNPYFYKTNYEITELGAGSGSVGLPGTHYCGSNGVWHQFRPYDEDAVLLEIYNDVAYYTTATAMYKQALSQLPNGTRTVILNQTNVVVRASCNSFGGPYFVYGTGWYVDVVGVSWQQLNNSSTNPISLHSSLFEDTIVYQTPANHVVFNRPINGNNTWDFGVFSNITKLTLVFEGNTLSQDQWLSIFSVLISYNNKTALFLGSCEIIGDPPYTFESYSFLLSNELPYRILFCTTAVPLWGSWEQKANLHNFYIANELNVYRVGFDNTGLLVYVKDVTFNLTKYSETTDLLWDYDSDKLYLTKSDAVYILDEITLSWQLYLSATSLNRFALGSHGTDLAHYKFAVLSPTEVLITNITAVSTTVVNTGSAETNAVLTFIGKCYISRIAIANDKNPQILCEILISDASESVVVDTEAGTIISSTRGSLASMLLPGSNMAGFKLQPGANTVQLTVVKTDVNTKFYCSWRNHYLSGKV